MKPTIVTITGPSCAGKTTLEKLLKAQGFAAVKSTTTRPMRTGEGDDAYSFIDKSEFKRLESQGAFIESVEFNDNYYGVTVADINALAEEGKPVVIVCEPSGQLQIGKYALEHDLNLFSVFVSNPLLVICERFIRRYTETVLIGGPSELNASVETYAKRLHTMMTVEGVWEIDAIYQNHYYDYIVEEFDETNTAEVVGTILRLTSVKEAAYA